MPTTSEKAPNMQVTCDSSIARKINSLLNSSKTRVTGLELLNSYLPHCSDNDFIEFCVAWMQNCCKVDGQKENKKFGVELLCALFKMSSNYQELKKSVSFFITTRYFDYFFKYLLNSQAGWYCTEACFLYYKGACGPFQDSIEKHLKCQIGGKVKIATILAKCFAMFPCLGGGGSDGINYRNNWRNHFGKLLNVSHSILNELFADVEELQEYDFSEYPCNKTEENSSPESLTVQLHNNCLVIQFMLLNQYPAVKSIPTDTALHLICRGLAINPKSLKKYQTADVIALQKVLPQIHDILLSLLKALIVTCKTQLFPYSHLICRLVKQTLEWTDSDFDYGSEKPFGFLRISAYEALCNWMATGKNGSCIETISSVVVSSAVSDIISKKEVVLLKESKQKRKYKEGEIATRRVDVSANSRLCHAALKTLQFLLKFAGVLLKAEEQKFLQEVVVRLISDIQNKSSSEMVVPFFVPACRKELYSLLLELVHHPCSSWPPPAHFALRLFSKGENDYCPDVSQFCASAVNYTSVIIHPQFDNGGFSTGDSSGTGTRIQSTSELIEPMEVDNTPSLEKGMEFPNESNVKENFLEADAEEKIDDESDALSDQRSADTVPYSEVEDITDTQYVSYMNEKTCEKEKNDSLLKTDKWGELTTKKIDFKKDNEEKGKTPSLPKEVGTPVKSPPRESSKTPKSVDEVSSAKSLSPESTGEEGVPKKRYFLRSNTLKGSSEEPEEVPKRTSSPESTRNTPTRNFFKNTPSAQSAKKPRTRAHLKTVENESESSTPKRSSHDEDENIIEAFSDSFVD